MECILTVKNFTNLDISFDENLFCYDLDFNNKLNNITNQYIGMKITQPLILIIETKINELLKDLHSCGLLLKEKSNDDRKYIPLLRK